MADRDFDPSTDPMAARNRVIRQRNVALALVLGFFVVLFFAITVVKMRHMHMPHKSPTPTATAPAAGGVNAP